MEETWNFFQSVVLKLLFPVNHHTAVKYGTGSLLRKCKICRTGDKVGKRVRDIELLFAPCGCTICIFPYVKYTFTYIFSCSMLRKHIYTYAFISLSFTSLLPKDCTKQLLEYWSSLHKCRQLMHARRLVCPIFTITNVAVLTIFHRSIADQQPSNDCQEFASTLTPALSHCPLG